MGKAVIAAVALGSNLGDRAAHLNHAISRLHDLLGDLRVSRFYETVPVRRPGPAAALSERRGGGAGGDAGAELLEALLAIEQERGRARPYPNAPRSLDLDLMLFGDAIIDEPGLIVPHPRFRERRSSSNRSPKSRRT